MAEQGRTNSTAEITTSSEVVHVDIDDYQPSGASFIEKGRKSTMWWEIRHDT